MISVMQDMQFQPTFQIKTSKRKNIPVSTSLLHNLEYSHTISLYSLYNSKLQKRRAYSERVIKDKLLSSPSSPTSTPISQCCNTIYNMKSIVYEY